MWGPILIQIRNTALVAAVATVASIAVQKLSEKFFAKDE